jgi:hypothetical protein
MKSDSDIERLLEDHLEETARPMPVDVLESAIEAVGRTRQGRAGIPFVDRLGRIPLVLGGVVATLLLLVTVTMSLDRFGFIWFGQQPSLTPTPLENPRRWDPAADFRLRPNEQNPGPDSYGNDDTWAYLRTPTDGARDPSRYVSMTEFLPAGPTRFAAWADPLRPGAEIGVSKAEGFVAMTPYVAGDDTVGVVLRWLSPFDGSVRITGKVTSIQFDCPVAATGVRFYIDRGGVTLESYRLQLAGSANLDLTASVGRGEALHFVVDPLSASNCDTISLEMTIIEVARS